MTAVISYRRHDGRLTDARMTRTVTDANGQQYIEDKPMIGNNTIAQMNAMAAAMAPDETVTYMRLSDTKTCPHCQGTGKVDA